MRKTAVEEVSLGIHQNGLYVRVLQIQGSIFPLFFLRLNLLNKCAELPVKWTQPCTLNVPFGSNWHIWHGDNQGKKKTLHFSIHMKHALGWFCFPYVDHAIGLLLKFSCFSTGSNVPISTNWHVHHVEGHSFYVYIRILKVWSTPHKYTWTLCKKNCIKNMPIDTNCHV